MENRKFESIMTFYQKTLSHIEKSQFEPAAFLLRKVRKTQLTDYTWCYSHALLAARLALKSGHLQIDDALKDPSAAPSVYFRAEAHFVHALASLMQCELPMARVHLLQAAEIYRSIELKERELLCRYNLLVCDPELLTQAIDNELQMDQMRALEQECRLAATNRILSLVLRQKSYLYFDQGLFKAALAEIEKALVFSELEGAKSDYHIALIHAADCSLELGLTDRAEMFLEYIPVIIDARIEFPLAYVKAKKKSQLLEPDLFRSVQPQWMQRYKAYEAKVENILGFGLPKNGRSEFAPTEIPQSEIQWNFATGEITDETGARRCRVKTGSLEGRLLAILANGKITKRLMGERLWPEYSETAQIDNRVHRLISRLNHKTKNIVAFDGQFYHLKRAVRIYRPAR